MRYITFAEKSTNVHGDQDQPVQVADVVKADLQLQPCLVGLRALQPYLAGVPFFSQVTRSSVVSCRRKYRVYIRGSVKGSPFNGIWMAIRKKRK